MCSRRYISPHLPLRMPYLRSPDFAGASDMISPLTLTSSPAPHRTLSYPGSKPSGISRHGQENTSSRRAFTCRSMTAIYILVGYLWCILRGVVTMRYNGSISTVDTAGRKWMPWAASCFLVTAAIRCFLS